MTNRKQAALEQYNIEDLFSYPFDKIIPEHMELVDNLDKQDRDRVLRDEDNGLTAEQEDHFDVQRKEKQELYHHILEDEHYRG